MELVCREIESELGGGRPALMASKYTEMWSWRAHLIWLVRTESESGR